MGLPRTSQLVVDSDITIPTAYKLLTKYIQAISGELLYIKSENGVARQQIDNSGISALTKLSVDHIGEYTAAHGIVHDNSSSFSASLYGENLYTGHLHEISGGHGIIIDAGIPLSLDHIKETTGAHGIVLDNLAKLPHPVTGAGTVIVGNMGVGRVDRVTANHLVCGLFIARVAGTYRLAFTLLHETAGEHSSAQIYVNGSAAGTLRTQTGAGATEFTEDIALAAGDKVTIWGHYDDATTGYITDSWVGISDAVNEVLYRK